MNFTATILKLAILIYSSKNQALDLRSVSEQNGIVYGDFVHK